MSLARESGLLALCVLKTLLISLAAFSIITMLPCQVFHTESVEWWLNIAACVILGFSTAAEVIKRFISTTDKMDIDHDHADFEHTLKLTSWLTLIAIILSFSTFVWNCAIFPHVQITDVVYFFLLTCLLVSTRFVSLGSRIMIAFPYENPALTANAKLAFVCDHVLLASYIGICLHINFLEAKETVDLYGARSKCIEGHLNSTGHHEHGAGHEIIESGAYATTVEVVALLVVCHLHQKHFKRRMHKIESNKSPEQLLQKDRIDHYAHTDGQNSNFIGCMPYKSILDVVVFIISTLIVLGILFSIATFLIKHEIGKEAAQNVVIVSLKTCLFGFLAFYLLFLRYDVRNLFNQAPRETRQEIASSLDMKLLKYSAYGTLLLVLLLLAACASGHEPVNPWLFYSQNAFNILQIWLQNCFVFDCLATKKYLKSTGATEWKDLRIHVLPLGLANLLLWLYNLWQWKIVAMVGLPPDVSPGAVWAVTEAILFPMAIFYRFHSFFLCCIICQCQCDQPKWLRRIRKREAFTSVPALDSDSKIEHVGSMPEVMALPTQNLDDDHKMEHSNENVRSCSLHVWSEHDNCIDGSIRKALSWA